MKLMRIGVDLAKNVFQIHGVDSHEKPVWRQRLTRERWLQTIFEKIEPGCEIGMESCGLRALDERIKELDSEISVIAANEPRAQVLQQLRGVGPMIATALVVAIGDASQFANGRQFAASLGLTPRQHSSDGKDRLLGISKRGDTYLRTLMVHGARSALRTAQSKDDRLSQWAVRLAGRSHVNVAAIALANKTARMAWAMLRNGTEYQPERAAA